MIADGRILDMGPLTQGARELVLFTSKLGADELYGDDQLSYILYDTLKSFAQKYFGKAIVAASGECVFGMDADDEYTQPLDASESYLTGTYDGICPVMLDEPVHVDEVQTFFVPALEFRVSDILGVAGAREVRKTSAASRIACFQKVAMPLVVQTPTIYALS